MGQSCFAFSNSRKVSACELWNVKMNLFTLRNQQNDPLGLRSAETVFLLPHLLYLNV